MMRNFIANVLNCIGIILIVMLLTMVVRYTWYYTRDGRIDSLSGMEKRVKVMEATYAEKALIVFMKDFKKEYPCLMTCGN